MSIFYRQKSVIDKEHHGSVACLQAAIVHLDLYDASILSTDPRMRSAQISSLLEIHSVYKLITHIATDAQRHIVRSVETSRRLPQSHQALCNSGACALWPLARSDREHRREVIAGRHEICCDRGLEISRLLLCSVRSFNEDHIRVSEACEPSNEVKGKLEPETRWRDETTLL